jgi:uncharacterized protein
VVIPARINLVTLACRDVDRMTKLFCDIGWQETPGSDQHHRTFQCSNGVVLALFAASNYEQHFGLPSEGFRGFTLAINLDSFEACLDAFETLRIIKGVELLEEPRRTFWGGGFSWRDPEGNVWDMAWAKDARIDERGGLQFP